MGLQGGMPYTLLIPAVAALLLATVGCAKKPDDCKIHQEEIAEMGLRLLGLFSLVYRASPSKKRPAPKVTEEATGNGKRLV